MSASNATPVVEPPAVSQPAAKPKKKLSERQLLTAMSKRSLTAFFVLAAALFATSFITAVAPPAGSVDVPAQLPWAAPYLLAFASAHKAALRPGSSMPTPGWADALLYANTTRRQSGLAVEDVLVGEGAELSPIEIVEIKYKLFALVPRSEKEGVRFVFSQSAKPVVMRMNGEGAILLPGQLDTLQGMRRGGQRRAVIPPSLGFGSTPRETIPAFATLLFFVEMLELPGAEERRQAERFAALKPEEEEVWDVLESPADEEI